AGGGKAGRIAQVRLPVHLGNRRPQAVDHLGGVGEAGVVDRPGEQRGAEIVAELADAAGEGAARALVERTGQARRPAVAPGEADARAHVDGVRRLVGAQAEQLLDARVVRRQAAVAVRVEADAV